MCSVPDDDYTLWALRSFPQARFNLARSGIPSIPLNQFGMPRSLDDPGAYGRLRERLAERCGTAPARLLPALGATHAAWLAFAALLRPGDELLVEQPAYPPFLRMAEQFGAQLIPFERLIDRLFVPDPAEIEASMSERTRAVVLTTRHNPSGCRIPADVLRHVAELCHDRGAFLVLDDVYAEFDEETSDEAASAALDPACVVRISSLSKSHGLGALRIGWLSGPESLVERAHIMSLNNVGDPLPIAQVCVADHVLANLGNAGGEARQALRDKEELVGTWIDDNRTLRWVAPQGGPFGWVQVEGCDNLTDVIEHALATQNVLVAPGRFFGTPNAFRIAWTLEEAALKMGLFRLGELFRTERII